MTLVQAYFKTGDLREAMRLAGYSRSPQSLSAIRSCFAEPKTAIGAFYERLINERVKSVEITAESKRLKLWSLVEYATEHDDMGQPKNSKLALQCIDMLNRMDGHYAPLEVNTKGHHRIQQEVVTFRQEIPIKNAVDVDIELDKIEEAEGHRPQPADNLPAAR
ncbi:MAG: hypothetical protein JAY71_19370 [Candidatus Thiodiazotropha weberae]|nr:hypothetical protein [Candidatus Thiodiazotropha weberae]